MPTQTDSPGSVLRTRWRLAAILAALAVYVCIALWMKPGTAAHISDSLADMRDSVVDRFHKHPDHPIDRNTAAAAELEQLPGVGPATAAQIIRFREQSGPFRRPEDLLAIPRITRRALDRIRPYIFVGEQR
jgi:competence ComEA-like helix-hairpin-helix protein